MMNYLGSRKLETKRLFLHETREKDLKILWNILLKEEISKYYLVTKINKNWEKEKIWQYKKLEKAQEKDVFCWTIEKKDTKEIIGQISVQELTKENQKIRDIGWFIDTPFQKQGFAYEAAIEVLKYMFLEVEIDSIKTCVAIINKSSWRLMEKLGFKRLKTTHFVKYTLLEEPIEVYEYECKKKSFLQELFRKEKLYITETIDKDPYLKHLTESPVLNITGLSSSGKTTATEKYKNDSNYIVVDIDELMNKSNSDKNIVKLKKHLIKKYKKIPNIEKEFDTIYNEILKYFNYPEKYIIIESNNFINMKDILLLKGDIIILRTCLNTCHNRVIENNNKSINIYQQYHALNSFIDRIDNKGGKNE